MLERLFQSLWAFSKAFAEASPGGSALELDGVRAALVPAMPDRSVVNCVAYDEARALESQLDRLPAAYDDAGILAWTVWVPGDDGRAGGALERAAHALDAEPMAMARELDGVERPAPGDLTLIEDPEPPDMTAVIAESYAWPNVTEALVGWPEGFHPYVALADGSPACCLAIADHGDDAHVTLVGTVPAARGRGLATLLMRRALADATERGCRTSTLVATRMGHPVYARLGYRDLGRVQMWERRKQALTDPEVL